MAKHTLASLAARLEALEAKVAAQPAVDPAYVADFFARKKREKQDRAAQAPRPAGESPTFKALLLQAAAQYNLPISKLRFVGGKVMHGQQELPLH